MFSIFVYSSARFKLNHPIRALLVHASKPAFLAPNRLALFDPDGLETSFSTRAVVIHDPRLCR